MPGGRLLLRVWHLEDRETVRAVGCRSQGVAWAGTRGDSNWVFPLVEKPLRVGAPAGVMTRSPVAANPRFYSVPAEYDENVRLGPGAEIPGTCENRRSGLEEKRRGRGRGGYLLVPARL